MTDPRLANAPSVIESSAKLFVVALGLLYFLGFLVVSSHLGRYGVSCSSVLQLQYLIAGIWALAPPVLLASLAFAQRRFDEGTTPEVKGEFNWRRFAISTATSFVPSSLFFILLLLIPHVKQTMTWGTLGRLYLFFLAMVYCAQFYWMSRRADARRETWWMNRRHAAPIYLASLLMIVLYYTLWFSVRIYPMIPFTFGGGKPLTVAFFEGEKTMPDEIQKADRSAKRSVPYKLLLATDKSFVVISPSCVDGPRSCRERSVEISRDSVAGMVVLGTD